MKKQLFYLLAAFILPWIMSNDALAHDFVVNGIYYTITSSEDHTVSVSYRGNRYADYTNRYSGAVSIPEMVTYNDVDYDVTGIGIRAFWGCTNLTSVTLPESIITIAEAAFNSCTQLSSIEIPNSVLSIDDDAFYKCTGLKSISIGTGLNSFATSALSRCTNLSSIAVDSENPNYDSRGNCNAIIKTANNTLIKGCNSSIIPSDVAAIGNSAFENCTGLIDVELPIGLISIGDNAFYGCTGINSIEIPNSVTSIGYQAFRGCNEATSIIIGDAVTAVGSYAFYDCSKVTLLKIGSEVKTIGSSAFQNCIGITNVSIPDNASINASAFFDCTGLTSVEFGSGVYAHYSAFKNCPIISISLHGVLSSSLLTYISPTEIIIKGDVTNVPNDFLKGNSNITSVVIENGVKQINDYAFAYCKGITTIDIPNSVTTIGECSFVGCSNLSVLTLGNGIETLGCSAFQDCTSLTSIFIPKSVIKIEDERDHATLGTAFNGCINLENIVVENGNPIYDSRDNCNSIIETASNMLIIGCRNSFIPNGVTSIKGFAFSGCTGLTSIEFPSSVTSIGREVFSGCSDLENVVIGENVTSIYRGAFANCTSLNSVYCYGKRLLSIGSDVFEGSNIGNVTLYVPQAYISQYQAVEPWKNFKEIKEIQGPAYRDNQSFSLTVLPSMTYGDEYTLPTTTDEGLPLTWSVEDNTIVEVNDGKLITKKAGTTKVIASQDGNDSYHPFYKEFTLTIDKAQLYVVANNQKISLGEDIPELTFDYWGFLLDDDASSLLAQPTVTTTATTDSPAGIYPITVSGAESDKYEIICVEGNLNIAGSKEMQSVIPIPDIYKSPVVADINGDGKVERIEVVSVKPESYRSKQALGDNPEKNICFIDGKYYLKIAYEVATGKFLVKGKIPTYTEPIESNYVYQSTNKCYKNGKWVNTTSENWASADSIVSLYTDLNYEKTYRYAYYEIKSQDDIDYYLPLARNLSKTLYANMVPRDTVYVGDVDVVQYGITRSVKQYQIVLRKQLPEDWNPYYLTFRDGLVVKDGYDSWYSESSSPGVFVDIDGVTYYRIAFSMEEAPSGYVLNCEAAFTENDQNKTFHYFPIHNQGDFDYFMNINYNQYYNTRYRYEDNVIYALYYYKSASERINSYIDEGDDIICRWRDIDGNVVQEITGESLIRDLSSGKKESLMSGNNVEFVDDLNNDGIPDFIANAGTTAKYNSRLWLSKGSGYENTDWNNGTPYAIDFNHDGKKDLVTISNKSLSIYIQGNDGNFMQQDVQLITDEEELENAIFKQKQDNKQSNFEVSYYGISNINGMFVQAKPNDGVWPDEDTDEDDGTGVKKQRRKSIIGPTSGATEAMYSSRYEVMDINNDGYPDLLSTSDYVSILSLADGRYYTAALNGKVSVADLDGDGLKDIVIFDSKNSKVLLEMCQADGTFKETKLIENGSIEAIYCQDLNGDGKMDIMLQVPTTSYTILVFYKNNGNGTFKKYERSLSYKGKYRFMSEPLDLSNNGIPSLLVWGRDNSTTNQLERIDWDQNFNLTESYVTHENEIVTISSIYEHWYDEKDIPHYYYGMYSVFDYDGDGLLDIPVSNIQIGKYHKTTGEGLYHPESPQNTAPAQMPAPNAIIDPLRGLMKIDWQEGSDAQTASCDLSYEIRVGKTDGTNDMLQDDAGRSSTFMVNVGSWPLGDYYISMRAIDQSGMKGAWSPAMKVTHKTPTANILINKHEISTVDTLVVTMTGDYDYTLTVQPDGTIIKQEDGKAYITFADCGNKIVTAKINGGNTITEEIKVEAVRFTVLENSNHSSVSSSLYLDIDLDGKTERLYGSGGDAIRTFENGEYKPYESLFSADLTIYDHVQPWDINMDGLPDLYSSTGISKNGNEYQWLINQGDLDFEVSDVVLKTDTDEDFRSEYNIYADLNNDGLMDVISSFGTSKNYIYYNQGNNLFLKVPVERNSMDHNSETNGTIADLDNDGLLDIIVVDRDPYTSQKYIKVLHNKGGMKMENVANIPVEYASAKSGWNLTAIDIDGDGYKDIVYYPISFYNYSGYGGVAYYMEYLPRVVMGNKNMQYGDYIQLDGIPINADLDNDGKCEFLFDDGLGHKRGDVYIKEQSPFNFRSRPVFLDIDNDGKPEMRSSPMYKINSIYTNTAPTAPTSVLVNQTDSTIVVSWSGATDQETPLSMLRYNLSVKEKGATGENSYIISPMNGTSNIAKTMDLNNHQYRYATRYPIPFERFKAGKTYEIQVQTIDAWMEHSPFSQKVEFKPAAKALISMPEKGGVNIPVAFTYSDNTGATPTVNAGDGVVNGKTITWSTSGLKTVTVTSGAIRNIRQIEILETPVLDMDVPTKMLAGSCIAVNVPGCFNGTTSITGLTGSNGLTVELQQGNETATVTAPNRDGLYQLSASYEDEVFGKMTKTFDINVVGASFKPELKLVTVSNGKNKMNWDSQMSLPDADLFNGKVNIYRETSVSDSYELIGQADLSVGEFTDLDSRPDVTSDSYMMTLGTIYDTESRPSNVHTTMHLMANRGMGNNINLRWTPYVGADIAQYVIMAGPTPESLSEVAYVSGHTVSYTHERSSDAVTYYSVVYRLRSEVANAKEMRAPAIGTPEGESNVISSAEAYDVKMVTSIEIRSTEEDMILNENQQSLHLSAVVTPATATITTVEWSIIEGEEYASIASNGIVNMIPTTTGGFVVVQARAIDGSGVIETAEIPVEPVGDELLMGDANGDGEVNVSDIVEIVNSILANPSDKFVEAAANMNGDGEVNVTDIVLVVNIIMSANNARPFGVTATEATANDRLLLQTNSDHSLSLCLENEAGYVASQFDITLTDGQELEDVTINGERSNGHIVNYAKIGTDCYRVVVYSLENQTYNDRSGELMNIAVAGSGSVEVSDIIFVTQNAQERRFAPLYATTTGIRVVGQPDNMQSGNCYDLSGRKLQSSPVDKGIYIINGKKQIVK
mgnify:CR=1 FL=1